MMLGQIKTEIQHNAMKHFSQAVCEKIGFYVYVLKDPRTSEIFYVGKGVDNRVFHHIEEAITNPQITDKLDRIREIHSSHQEVELYLLRYGLTSLEALEIESACIDLLGFENLVNSVKGHNSWERGLKSVDEVVQYYDANPINIEEPSIIIIINKLFKRNMSPEQLYEATRTSWVIGEKRNKAHFAFAAYRGLVREIYSIQRWQQAPIKGRWEFIGQVSPDSIRDKYINQSLENYIKKGSQFPIRYTF